MLLATGVFAVALAPAVHQAIPHHGIHEALGFAEASTGAGAHGSHGEHGSHGGSGVAAGGSAELAGLESFKGKSQCPKKGTSAPVINDDFPEPPMRKSKGGELLVNLRAATGPTQIDGQTFTSPTYNGKFPGPTLVFCPGDLLRIDVQNDLEAADFQGEHAGETNIHTHGFHVSPRRPSDNVFVTIDPGDSFQYEYKIPRDHPPGAYWYHPHLHGQTNEQAYGGMAGAMVIRGGLDVQRGYRHIPTRVLVIQQTTLGDGETVQPGPQGPFIPEPAQLFVNGHLNPEIDIQPGELQRWRIYNTTAGQFVKLQLEGQPLRVLATDGNNLPSRTSEKEMLISPSSRREILVKGGPEGESELLALPFAQFGGDPSPQQTLATLDSQGRRVDDKMPPKRLNFQQPDLRDEKVDQRHKIVYTQEPPNFFINGKQFDPDRVDEMMKLNEVNEWTIRNSSDFWHTFHIHINDFQVTEVNGEPVKGKRFDDNVSVAPGGSVKMRYKPRQFTGKFVFHCHVLGHEDNGMMGVTRVTK